MSVASMFIDVIRSGWMTVEGIVSLKTPPEKSDNNYQFTTTYHSILWRHGAVDLDGQVRFKKYFHARKLKPGLYDVDPSWSERTLSHDELNGETMFDPAEEPRKVAREVLWYGLLHFWVFRNRPWSEVMGYIDHDLDRYGRKNYVKFWRSWYRVKRFFMEYGKQWVYRMGYLVPMIYVRAGYKLPFCNTSFVPPWHQVIYAVKCWTISRNEWGETSSRCLLTTHAPHFLDMPWLMRWAYANIYVKDLYRRYGDLSGLYKIYYGPSHPYTLYTIGLDFLPQLGRELAVKGKLP